MNSAAVPRQQNLADRLLQLRHSKLLRQNLILFAGGFLAGVGGFIYHAVAGRLLGDAYGQVASLVSLYAVGTAPALIIILVLARDSAGLLSRNQPAGITYLLRRSTRLVAIASLGMVCITALFARPAAAFLHLRSPIPVLVLGFAVAAIWMAAIPRGLLQGQQRFTGLSVNLSLEMVVRTGGLFLLVLAGYAVSGAILALFAGAFVAFLIGLFALRDHLTGEVMRVRFREMANFSSTAAVGTLGILVLYNVDVVLAQHFLNTHGASVYGALNKIGTIVFFFTLSVSQVLFPRVVEAVERNEDPSRLLLRSGAILGLLGIGALAVFAAVPHLILHTMYGTKFDDGIPYIPVMGIIGMLLSLDNLLVQFFMAVHDRWFVPILIAACLIEVCLITFAHADFGAVVFDVLIAAAGLLVALAVRYARIHSGLRPEMLSETA